MISRGISKNQTTQHYKTDTSGREDTYNNACLPASGPSPSKRIKLENPTISQLSEQVQSNLSVMDIHLRGCCRKSQAVPTIAAPHTDKVKFQTLDKIHHYVSKQDMAMLDSVAKNPVYGEKLQVLIAEGESSRLYKDPDTCNTLYWGVINEALSETEFLNMYHHLLLEMFFFPELLPDSPLKDVLKGKKGDLPELAKSLKSHTYRELSTILDKEEHEPHKIAKLNSKKLADLREISGEDDPIFYEIEVAGKITTESSFEAITDRYGEKFHLNHFSAWLSLFKEHGLIWSSYSKFSNPPARIIIPSLSLLMSIANSKAKPGYEIKIKPCFSAGGWESLKTFREKSTHPMALWHKDIEDSLIKPDGVYLGSLVHIHDIYHPLRACLLAPEIRHKILFIDTLAYTSVIEFYRRVLDAHDKSSYPYRLVKGCLTETDQLFLGGLEKLCTKSSRLPRKESLEQFLIMDIEDRQRLINRSRKLIDQEHEDYEEYIYTVSNDLNEPGRLTGTYLPYHSYLEWNMLVFQLIINHEKEIGREVLGVDIKEYQGVRVDYDCSKDPKTPPETRSDIRKIFTDELLGRKWHVDWWLRYLGNCEKVQSPLISSHAEYENPTVSQEPDRGPAH